VKDQRIVKVSDVKKVEHFESLVLEEVEILQKQKLEGTAIVDQLAAAETLLSAALRFHIYSTTPRIVDGVTKNLRRGNKWEELRDALVAKLRSVRLEFLKSLAAANEQKRLGDLIERLMANYPQDADIGKAIAVVQIAEVERLLKTTKDQDAISARILLDRLQSAFPGAGGDNARKLRAQVHDLAVKALTRSQEKVDAGDEPTARIELARAESIEPDLDGIREMKKRLRLDYPILFVGARQLPHNISPATARLDSEKQALELVFEGLMEEVPDPSGAVRYRPGAALTFPNPFPGGREFLLRVLEKDGNGRPLLDSHDVVGTVTLMRGHTELQHSWSAYPLTWLAQVPPSPKDNGTVRISFGFSHPDPRSAFTFKILPARWLMENGKSIDDVFLAEKPFGSGPFIVQSNSKEVWFVNNKDYGRFDRAGLPSLREIRFVDLSRLDAKAAIQAFQEGKLHILPDLPTSDLDKFTSASELKGKVDVATASINRRVHILAVNLKRPYMQSKDLRQALSFAIDREEILRKVFRAQKPEFHRAMTGPFPPNTWAVAKGAGGPEPLMKQDLAVVRLKAFLANANVVTEFNLLYPDDDPQAELACNEIQKQISSLFKNEGPGNSIKVQPKKYPMTELLKMVQDQHSSYDLAYIPFDYPDDWYPYALGAALDPLAAGFRGRNWFNYTRETCPNPDDQALSRALDKIRTHRDFTGEVVPLTYTIGKLFNDTLPFIPLWQLDRHMVVSKRLKLFVDDSAETVNPRLLNPTLLFQGVARWRLE
jgi:ABC-type transport system substrate-binding protein